MLVRVDFNVPFRPGTTEISDDTRIRASLPTIRYLRDRECKVVLCSHLGRPRGRVVDELRLAPVSRRLADLLGTPVAQARDCVGPDVRHMADGLRPGQVLMLDNTRFHAEEEANDAAFARDLGSPAKVYVNDAFGAAHRAHASTAGVAHVLPAVAGFLMARELEMLGSALASPRRPFVAILGGAKVSDKIAALRNLVDRVDSLVVGGGMAATFFKADGLQVGDSLVEDDQVPVAAGIARDAGAAGKDLLLPTDVVVATAFEAHADHKVVDANAIEVGWRTMDVGPKTIAAFAVTLSRARTVVWNGPMGVFEWEPFAEGTREVARTLAGLSDATTVIGGGSTAEAVHSLGLADRMTHVSTGGGASLKFLEGKTLPGVAALMDR